MSINITIHGSPIKCSKKKRYLVDDDMAKRELLEERKKLRLKQVRQKSKEVAEQVRKNVDEAKKNKLKAIEEVKAREDLLVREEKLRQKREELQNTLRHVGESHRAAADINCPCSGAPCSCKQVKDKWGEVRPTEPKKKSQPTMSYGSFCRERAKKSLNKENLSPRTEKLRPSPEVPESLASHSSSCRKKNRPQSSESSSRATLYSPYRRTTPKRRSKRVQKKLVKTPSVILEIDSEDESSGVDLEDTLQESNMKFTRVSSNIKQKSNSATISGQVYNVSDYRTSDSSSAEQTLSKVRFTQISDLIKQQDNKGSKLEVIEDRSKNMPSIQERCKEASSQTTDIIARSPSPPRISPKPSTHSKGIPNFKTTKVQFFDYRNKFHKRYNQPKVVRNEEYRGQPNAMQQAEEENHLSIAHQEHLNQIKQNCERRSQHALEKEKVRRDYEDLTAKLEALSKEKTRTQLVPEDAHLFSEARLKQVSSECQTKMNSAVENVLKRPVLITCPEVEKVNRLEGFGKATEKDLNVSSTQRPRTIAADNSDHNTSDSCASILLNYVNTQSKQISDDINNCDNSEKEEKLKDLLERINCLRRRLLEELEKAKRYEKTPDIKEVADSIGTLRKEREVILLGLNTDKEKKLQKKEKKLEKREKLLEEKLKEFYEMTKGKTDESNSTVDMVENETIKLSPRKLKANAPLEIVIKLKDDSKTTKKSPYKISRKRSSLINSPRKRKVRTPGKSSSTELSQKLKKCHADLRRCQAELEKCNANIAQPTTPQNVANSTSTSYRSPPSTISPPLKATVEKVEMMKKKKPKDVIVIKTPAVSARSAQSEVTAARASKPASKFAKPTQVKRIEPPKVSGKGNLNPVLVHYIQRLLGMSRSSIEMLGVSTSELDTPSSSIIETTANECETESILEQRDKIKRLEKFIQNSYNFANEMETSLKTTSTDSSRREIEEVWKRVLKNKEKQKTPSDRAKSPKPILKKDKPKKAPQTTETARSKKSDDADKIQLVSKYTELTENCAQRIAELTEMINKVRQEKQRILEITLSSASASARSTTEYVDFPDGGTDKPECIIPGDEIIQVEQESGKGRLEKNKLTGVSRDSGISMSRPMTALDFRDSPALQICAQANAFEPILKDIPKPTKAATSPLQPIPQRSAGESSKKVKPPATMTRYSPQLDDLPHELSTIIEVDTTPRISVSNIEKQLKDPILQLEKDKENISYSKFPTFEEYVKRNKIDLTLFEPNVSSKLQQELQDLLNVAAAAKEIQCWQGPPKCKEYEKDDEEIEESIENLVQSLKLLNLSMKRFPTHQEYLDKLQRTDLQTSRVEKSSDNGEDKNKSEAKSIESLPDIVGELIRRKMLKHSFQNVNSDEKGKHTKGAKSDSSKCRSPRSTSEEKSKSHPKKKTVSSKDVEDELLSGLELLQFSNQSNSDNIEKELEGMGLKWAALMLRKSQDAQHPSSTSSSILYTSRRKSGRRQRCPKDMTDDSRENHSTTLQDSLEGRRLNLKDFLAKELQKRTQVSSSSSTDDSLASQFIRSMFGSDGTSSEMFKITSNDAFNSEQHTNRILTSTPVPPGSTSSSKPSTHHSSRRPFGAESLSTVRYSHSDSDGPNNTSHNLIPPNVRLDSKTINSYSSKGHN